MSHSIEFTLTLTIKGQSLQAVDEGLVQAAGERLQARILQRAEAQAHQSAGADPKPSHGAAIHIKTSAVENGAHGKTSAVENGAHGKTSATPAVEQQEAAVEPEIERTAGPARRRGRPTQQKHQEEPKGGQHGEKRHADEEKAGSNQKSEAERQVLEKPSAAGPVTGPKTTAAGAHSTITAGAEASATEPMEIEAAAEEIPIPSPEAVMKALTAVSETHGMEKARAVLEKFHVGRVRELAEDLRQEFINYCEKVVANR